MKRTDVSDEPITPADIDRIQPQAYTSINARALSMTHAWQDKYLVPILKEILEDIKKRPKE